MKLDVSLPHLDQAEGYQKYSDIENYPWKIETNSVDELISVYAIQRVKDILRYYQEVHRVCKPGAIVRFIAPYFTHERACCDPNHIRYIGEMSFHYLTPDFRKLNKVNTGGWETVNFQLRGINFTWETQPYNQWDNKSDEAKLYAKMHYWNVITDILAEFEVVK